MGGGYLTPQELVKKSVRVVHLAELLFSGPGKPKMAATWAAISVDMLLSRRGLCLDGAFDVCVV